MFASVTATGVIDAATSWVSSVNGVVLIVIGFGVMLTLAGWVIAKLARRGGGKRRKK
jgi:hypothetical protein